MHKLKIAVIGLKGLPAFGGAATVGENIIEQLKDEFKFTVYAVSSHTDRHGEVNGYYQHVFSTFFIKKLNVFLYYLKSMLHALFTADYDVIHLHHADAAFIIPFLRIRYKVICTSHAQAQVNEKWPGYVKFFFKINEWIMLRTASQVTAVSIPLTEAYKSMIKRNILYIPNGISLQQPVSDEFIPFNDYLLFAAGRIIPLKGLHVLLKAVKTINYTGKLLVVGDLDQLPKYKEEILELSKGLNVEFVDIIKEKTKLLNFVKNAKLFIFPSYSENMSIMLLEAAYVKTPVICSDIPANKAIFEPGEVLFFKTNDEKDLADKLMYAEQNTEALREHTRKAFEKLTAQYNWTDIAAQYKTLYLQLAK